MQIYWKIQNWATNRWEFTICLNIQNMPANKYVLFLYSLVCYGSLNQPPDLRALWLKHLHIAPTTPILRLRVLGGHKYITSCEMLSQNLRNTRELLRVRLTVISRVLSLFLELYINTRHCLHKISFFYCLLLSDFMMWSKLFGFSRYTIEHISIDLLYLGRDDSYNSWKGNLLSCELNNYYITSGHSVLTGLCSELHLRYQLNFKIGKVFLFNFF